MSKQTTLHSAITFPGWFFCSTVSTEFNQQLSLQAGEKRSLSCRPLVFASSTFPVPPKPPSRLQSSLLGWWWGTEQRRGHRQQMLSSHKPHFIRHEAKITIIWRLCRAKNSEISSIAPAYGELLAAATKTRSLPMVQPSGRVQAKGPETLWKANTFDYCFKASHSSSGRGNPRKRFYPKRKTCSDFSNML